jgi:hypothetical protein
MRAGAGVILLLALLNPERLAAQTAPGEIAAPQAIGIGHQQRVTSGLFTPDGKRFVSASDDRTIRVWNVADGKELFVLRGAASAIHALALAGEKLLISGGEDGSLALWNLEQQRSAGELPRQPHAIQCLAVSPDGKWLASGGGAANKPLPGDLRLWDLQARTLAATLAGHRRQVLALAFAPDGRTLAATDRAADVKVWDLPRRQATTFHEGGLPWSTRYSPDGKWLALGESWGQIRIRDAATLSEDSVTRAHKGGVFSLAYAPSGSMLVSAGFDGVLRLWNAFDVESETPLSLGTHRGPVWVAAFSPDGTTLASGGTDRLVKFWSIPPALRRRFQTPAPTAGPPTSAARSRSARVALVAPPEAMARTVQDLALARLTGTSDLVLLDRDQVDRLLKEQALPLSGLVDAGTAVRAGKILGVDLFAVLESSRATQSTNGISVFDAVSGVKQEDAGFTSSDLEPQALQVVAAVRAAAARWRAGHGARKTLCFLPVRNADLPRAMDRFCETQAAMLGRELLATGSAAVLERRRLDLVNQEKDLVPEAARRELLASVLLVSTEIARGRDGKGIRATVTLRDNAAKELHRISAEVADPNGVGLLPPLVEQIQHALKATPTGVRASRHRESRRFLREAQLNWEHKLYEPGLRAAEAAFALQPGEDARLLLTEYLLGYASDLLYPGGMRTLMGSDGQLVVTPEKLREALVLARRALLLIDTARSRLANPRDAYEVWRGVEPASIISAERLFYNKLPHVVLPPADLAVQQELRDLRLFCLRRLIDRCLETARDAGTDPKALSRYTEMMTNEVEKIGFVAPSVRDYARALAELGGHWLDLAEVYSEEQLPLQAAARFGKFLGQVSQKPLFPGVSEPEARDIALTLVNRAASSPAAIGRLYATHFQIRLLVSSGRLTPGEGLARHREMLAEGQHLIDHPPLTTANAFRAAMYHLLGESMGSLYLHKTGRAVITEYLDLCDFMLARGDVVEQVILDAVTYGTPERDLNLRALHVIDRALEVTDSPDRRLFDGVPERFKNHDLKPARHKLLTALPDLRNFQAPWESVKLLAGPGDLNATVVLRALPLNGHVYFFTGGINPETKHWQLQFARLSSRKGPPELLGKTDVDAGRLAVPSSRYSFWIVPEIFVTSTALVGDHLYVGTVTDGILGFPLSGGPPLRIAEKEGLPSRYVFKLDHVGSTLVAALEGGYLVTYDLSSGRLSTVASSRRGDKRSPLDDTTPFRVAHVAADPSRARVLFTLDLPSDRDPRAGIWEYRLSTGQFKKLLPPLAGVWSVPADGRLYFLEPSALLAYDLAEDRLQLLQGESPASYPELKPAGVPTGLSLRFPGWTFYPNRLLLRGYLWQGYPFQRRRLEGSQEELFPSLYDNTWTYPFSAKSALDELSPDELLIGNLEGLYLVSLKRKAR